MDASLDPAPPLPRGATGAAASPARVALLTATALVAFAANSLLCRAALRPGLVDPASFTWIRIASGAAALALLVLARRRRLAGGTPASALALFVYAAAFSFAYVRIGAGVGALLLFAAVQVTMVGWSAVRGVRPGPLQLVGVAVALAGLAWLALPGAGASDVDLPGAALMVAAGIAWGAYSLRGAGARDPLATTAHNFALAVPAVAVLGLAWAGRATLGGTGVALAVASGALASGGGYSLWYAAVPSLGATRAAAVQLAVPVLAGVGATAFLGERLTARVAVAGGAILAGIALTLRRRA